MTYTQNFYLLCYYKILWTVKYFFNFIAAFFYLAFLLEDEFPDHLKRQIEEERQREVNEKKKQEIEKQMCKVREREREMV